MCHYTPHRLGFFSFVGCVLAFGAANGRAADGNANEIDQFEERTLAKAVEKAVRATKSDRVQWMKELESEFPNKVGNPLKEEEYAVWFELLADKSGEWKRENSPNAAIKELFDKVIQRIELGPVPSIKREEFAKYAKKALIPGNPPAAGSAPDPNEDADKVFRVLDRDGDGILAVEELTTKLRDDYKKFDTDGNGRIDKDEYRAYFNRRVTVAVEAATAKPADQKKGDPDTKTLVKPGKAAGALPDWFTELDTKKDGQITLAAWRKSGRPVAQFLEMDLDGDGLLTKEEYQHYLQMQEMEEKE
jgi:Ca2+-binding EF-hand superfamily protein